MDEELAKRIVDAVAQDLLQFKFRERHDNVTDNIVGIVKKSWNPLRRVFGGHGVSAVVIVSESVTDRAGLKAFFQDIRKEINSRFVGFAAYKSSHSFIVLLCQSVQGVFQYSVGTERQKRSSYEHHPRGNFG